MSTGFKHLGPDLFWNSVALMGGNNLINEPFEDPPMEFGEEEYDEETGEIIVDPDDPIQPLI